MHLFVRTLVLFFITLLFSLPLMAEKVKITSDSMSAENMKKEVHFLGHVKITQLKNWLHGDKVVVYFDENNETKKYDAVGNVTFEFQKEDAFYKGKANKVTYFPAKSKYILSGKAVIDDKVNKRHVEGETIYFDMLTGNADVKGNKKKPVTFIFDMESKKK